MWQNPVGDENPSVRLTDSVRAAGWLARKTPAPSRMPKMYSRHPVTVTDASDENVPLDAGTDTSDDATDSPQADGAPSDGAVTDEGPGKPQIVFGPCPDGYQTECATLQVPLDHTSPDGETIDLHIARRPAIGEAKRPVWLLAGGPGQAGYIYDGALDDYAKRMPDAEFYAIDHRGTGYSHDSDACSRRRPGLAPASRAARSNGQRQVKRAD